jgi:ribosomal RNA-processing protein 7
MTKQPSDYTSLYLQLDSGVQHTLYLRRHSPRVPSAEDARSLFAVNLPVDATEAQLRSLFTSIGGGRVETVIWDTELLATSTPAPPIFNKKRKLELEAPPVPALPSVNALHSTGSTAVIRFIDAASATASLQAASKATAKKPAVLPDATPLGLARYTQLHRARFPSTAILQANLDAFIMGFEASEEAARIAAKKRAMADEDGFVTVTRGGRNGAASMEEAKRMLEEKRKQEEENKAAGFYRFQLREERKQKQVELVRRFEEDRKRVEERKQRRGRVVPE